MTLVEIGAVVAGVALFVAVQAVKLKLAGGRRRASGSSLPLRKRKLPPGRKRLRDWRGRR
jgi:hypothetical protein